ncbi:hypothetical protein J2S52_003617 [Streptomyces sp. DSM 41037]|nr:hypothetical protein [Streptomyces sp. DSM 41037]
MTSAFLSNPLSGGWDVIVRLMSGGAGPICRPARFRPDFL